MKNDLTITGSAVLDPNPINITIFLGGNWTNYNETGFNEGAVTLQMNGASNVQSITCPGGEVLYTIRYAKTGSPSSVIFNNNVDLIFQLWYTGNGYVDLNSNTLTIRNPNISGITGANFSKIYCFRENR